MSDRLAEIEERWENVTPGPWLIGRHAATQVFAEGCEVSARSVAACGGYSSNAEDADEQWRQNHANAEAIASAPEDIAWALEEIKRLTVALEKIATTRAKPILYNDEKQPFREIAREALAEPSNRRR